MPGLTPSHRFILVLLCLFGVLLFTLTIPAQTTNTCGVLNNGSITYTLNGPLNAQGNCFSVISPNIHLDCRFNTITGSGNGIGIRLTPGSSLFIENCVISGFERGIEASSSVVQVATSHITGNSIGILLIQNASIATATNAFTNNSLLNFFNNKSFYFDTTKIFYCE